MNYLKRNPVTAARQIDYVFKQLWDKMILSGMHPVGQSKFQNRGTKHMRALIHVVDASKIDQN